MDSMIGYLLARTDASLPEFDESHLWEYILAENGVFVRSKRAGLEATIPLQTWAGTTAKGLTPVVPYVELEKRVPLALTEKMMEKAKQAYPDEILFWLNYENGHWTLSVPEQKVTGGSAAPTNPFDPMGTSALADAHSHGAFPAFFSATDDKDETGFRLYLCFGKNCTQVTARIGIFGHMWSFPASWVCELPEGIAEVEDEA